MESNDSGCVAWLEEQSQSPAFSSWSASRVSYTFVLTPIVASILGAALAGEALSAAMLAGGVTILFGVYVGALSGSRAPRLRSAPTRKPEAVWVEATE